MTNPLFGLSLTLAVYCTATALQKKVKSPLLNPLLISSLVIITMLNFFSLSYDDFNIGGSMITSLIGPATVSLAIPLYKHKQYLIQYRKVILISVITGILAHALSLGLLALVLNLDPEIIASLIPKSVTTAIAADISVSLGGISIITICIVIITGILGSAFSPILVKVFKLKSDVAIGLALGTSAHAVGTSKAIETNELQGTMATLALILTGILTVLISPLTYHLILMLLGQ